MAPDDSEFKKITEDLYKKNLDLFNANRQLTLLQELYQIIVSTLTVPDLSQKFINTITNDLDFFAGAVFYHNQKTETLTLTAVSNAKPNQLTDALGKIPTKTIPLVNSENPIVKAYQGQQMQTSYVLKDVLIPLLPSEDSDLVQSATSLKSIVVLPISFGTQTLGSYVVFLRREASELTEFENDILRRSATVFGVAIDRLMIYLSLQEANAKLIELDQRKNEFLSMASHELRAPMTAIKGYLSMIIEGDAGEIPEKARGFLTDASAVTERLIRLVNNMLNVSRIEENRMVFQVETVHLTEVARTVSAEFKGEAVRKNLQFESVVPAEMNDMVTVDGDRIHEVVANLVSNAIKYTEKGTVTLELSQPNPQTVRCDIRDSGMGITLDEQVKLFKKFARAESAVGKTVGTGLGLYISKLLVEKFGGRIGLNSEFGKGSDFWFELPVAGSLEHNPPAMQILQSADTKPAGKVGVPG